MAYATCSTTRSCVPAGTPGLTSLDRDDLATCALLMAHIIAAQDRAIRDLRDQVIVAALETQP
jgi:hypothetical protein